MRGPRITVGGLMCIVVVLGIAIHLALAAVRVFAAKEYHFHTWLEGQGDRTFTTLAVAEQSPFWPRYWRCILGLPWKSLPLCPEVKGRLLDRCEFAHPEIRKSGGSGRNVIVPTSSQVDLARRLRNQSP
jgi:hypothetical protein